MQPLPLRTTRTRAVLAGAAALALASSLAACGSGGTTAGDAKAALGPGGGASTTPSAAQSSTPPPKPKKVLQPTGPAADLAKVRDTAAGPIMVTRLTGAKSGVTGQVWVWLPPQYNDPKYKDYGFPVLTLYAGGQSAGYNTWTDNQLPIQEIDNQLAAAGRTHPFIMIMPVQNLESNEAKALECSDIPGQPKMGTWMAEDIPDFVRANFRTVKGRDGWAVAGASTGAFCSAKLALQHPDVFKAAVPIDGYWNPDSPLWKGHEQERVANSPDALAAAGKADVRILATAGGANAYETRLVKAWIAKVAAPATVEYYEQPGGKHLTSDFKKMIPAILEWLGKNVTGPQNDD
ncbi:alpha/beta hydrolase [Kitasatospora sp. NPDC048365]|uniref:alpha/beta hydrolase n=1 Tax=Kitasatospora sp. NPDC048365 TaxID=3364050 RepID=UPI003718240F